MFKSWRDSSKEGWGCTDREPTLEQINAGSFMRIADAVERMAQRHTELMEQRDRFEKWYREEQKRNDYLKRGNASLRGHLKRTKWLLEQRKSQPVKPVKCEVHGYGCGMHEATCRVTPIVKEK